MQSKIFHPCRTFSSGSTPALTRSDLTFLVSLGLRGQYDWFSPMSHPSGTTSTVWSLLNSITQNTWSVLELISKSLQQFALNKCKFYLRLTWAWGSDADRWLLKPTPRMLAVYKRPTQVDFASNRLPAKDHWVLYCGINIGMSGIVQVASGGPLEQVW